MEDDQMLAAIMQKANAKGGKTEEVRSGSSSSCSPSSQVSPSAHFPKGQIIVKEMFCHTTLKIYPDGNMFITITGRPKDFEYKPRPSKNAKPIKKATKLKGEDEL